jgi:mannitol-1-phosphate/altronate dehydrogenase
LIKEYPQEFNEENQKEHIEDLLKRFKNIFLNDTIYRVGRDIQRKLGSEDRLIGALRMDIKHNIDYENTAKIIASAMLFSAKDENGKLFLRDEKFVNDIYSKGVEYVLTSVCKLDTVRDIEIINKIVTYHNRIREGVFLYID